MKATNPIPAAATAAVAVAPAPRWTIALVGNPNTGKTTLFNALAGMRQRVGNYPGVTVIPIQANKRKGLDALRTTLAEIADGSLRMIDGPAGPTFPEDFEREVATLKERLGESVALFLVRRLLLDVGGYTEKRLADA